MRRGDRYVFLEPFYEWLESVFGGRVNHLPLVRLLVYSVDHTVVLFVGWLIIWVMMMEWHRRKNQSAAWRWELYRHGFVFYLLLLFQLTVFRMNRIFELMPVFNRPLSEIQWVPFVDSVKLFQHGSLFAAYYNVFGNVLWFMPLGLFCGMLYGRSHGRRSAFWIGLVTSVVIEMSQFIFMTGVTHIDDVICNVVGSVLGYWCYEGYQWLKGVRNEKRNHR